MTKNSINATSPLGIASGGTATSSFATQYGVAYYDGTKIATTGAGTTGQVLTSAGSGSAPTFQSPSGSAGAWVLISTQTASAASAIIFSGLSSTYNIYMLSYGNVVKSGGAVSIYAQCSTNNGTSYVTTNMSSPGWYLTFTTAALSVASSANLMICRTLSGSVSGTAYFTGFGLSTMPQLLEEGMCNLTTTTGNIACFGFGIQAAAGVYNCFKVYPASGTFTGTFSLYGLMC